jgi:hypothetical protein
MHLKETLEEFKQLPTATQVVLVLFVLVLVILLAVFPTMSTSILAFLVALKAITTR